MGTGSSYPPPPKFGGPGPADLGDWVTFFRWLSNLGRKAYSGIDAGEAIALASQGGRQSGAGQPQETLGAALAFQGARPMGARPADELTGLVAAARPPYAPKPWANADTHANRLALYPAASYPPGSPFYESDRTVSYADVTGVWTYSSGVMAGTFANLPGDLGAADAGFLYRVTTGTGGVAYNHLVRWNGTGWDAADAFGGFFQDFALAPIEPGWQICDGSVTKCLQIAAGVVSEAAFTTPDLTSGVYRKGAAAGAYTGTINAAGTVTLAGNTGDTSAGTPAGTIAWPGAVPTISGIAIADHAAHTHTIAQSNFTTTNFTVNAGGSPAYTGGGIVTTPTGNPNITLTHTVTNQGTISWPGAVPTFNGTAMGTHHHDLSAATATLTGDPVKNISTPTYFRR